MRYGTGADNISAISIGIIGTRGWTHSNGRVSAARESTTDESSPRFSLTTITLHMNRDRVESVTIKSRGPVVAGSLVVRQKFDCSSQESGANACSGKRAIVGCSSNAVLSTKSATPSLTAADHTWYSHMSAPTAARRTSAGIKDSVLGSAQAATASTISRPSFTCGGIRSPRSTAKLS